MWSIRSILKSFLATLCCAGLLGCHVEAGAPCKIDSDCAPGTLCAPDWVCRSFDEVQAQFLDAGSEAYATDQQTPDTAGTSSDTLPTDTPSDTPSDTSGCTPVAGVFEKGASPCPEPALKKEIAGLEITDSGHAAKGLAALGNPVIRDGFEKGEIALSLWVDGSLEPGCEATLAWMESATDRRDDCTAVHTDTVPFTIPGLVAVSITEATYDAETQLISGLISKAEVMNSLDPALAEAAGNLIDEDVDSDGDGVFDRTTIIVKVTFK